MSRLEIFGWTESLEARFQPLRSRDLVPARVVVEHSESWSVESETGLRRATLSGRLRHQARSREDLPAVGDWVAVAERPDEGRATVVEVVPRTTALVRKAAGRASSNQVLAANVDLVLVVAALDGDFNLRRIERSLAVVWESGAQPVLVLNKADLRPDPGSCRLEVEGVAPGVPVHVLSALDGSGVDALVPCLKPGQTSVVLGSSGVGKSTLINRLLGEDRLAVGEVRSSDGRGQHTTTARALLVLPGGALLVDTPGLREIGLPGSAEGLESAFADVEELGRSCRFRDCRHQSEPGCAVRESLDPDRLASWRKLQREAEYEASRTDARIRRERAQRWKRIGKANKARETNPG